MCVCVCVWDTAVQIFCSQQLNSWQYLTLIQTLPHVLESEGLQTAVWTPHRFDGANQTTKTVTTHKVETFMVVTGMVKEGKTHKKWSDGRETESKAWKLETKAEMKTERRHENLWFHFSSTWILRSDFRRSQSGDFSPCACLLYSIGRLQVFCYWLLYIILWMHDCAISQQMGKMPIAHCHLLRFLVLTSI